MKKAIAMIFITLAIIALTATGIWLTLRKPEEETITPIGTAEMPEEIFSPGEVDDLSPTFLFNEKTTFATECNTLPRYAKLTIEEWLSKYLNYYLTIPTTYYGDYVSGSYRDDVNTPSFDIKVNLPDGTDLRIKCVYNISLERYAFDSDLNE